jgi:hypothetical protein
MIRIVKNIYLMCVVPMFMWIKKKTSWGDFYLMRMELRYSL